LYAARVRRADRLFQLVQLLRMRRFRTAAELAADLAVSARTVYRDVSDLIGSGVPIEGEPGVGYRLLPGYELPPLTFSREEIEALVLGARMVQAWGGEELALSAKSAITKIEAVLPAPLRELVAGTALFAPSGAWSREVVLGLDVLRRAISERRKLRFAYVDQHEVGSERSARPLGLYFWGAKWLLAAYCELRSDYRSFRADRMRAIEVLDERFGDADGIDLAGFLRHVQADRSTQETKIG
jgi:predicted DNA-binding transcriptional regulator YafY